MIFKRYEDLIDFENIESDKLYYNYNSSEILFKNDVHMNSKTTIFVLKIITISIIFTFFSYHMFIWIKPYVNFTPISLYLDQIKLFRFCKGKQNLNKLSDSNLTLLKTNSSNVFDKNSNFNINNNNENMLFSMTDNYLNFENLQDKEEIEFKKLFNDKHMTNLKNIENKNMFSLVNSELDNEKIKLDKLRINRILFVRIIKASLNKNDSFIKAMLKINKKPCYKYNKLRIKHKNLTSSVLMNKNILSENLKRNISKMLRL